MYAVRVTAGFASAGAPAPPGSLSKKPSARTSSISFPERRVFGCDEDCSKKECVPLDDLKLDPLLCEEILAEVFIIPNNVV